MVPSSFSAALAAVPLATFTILAVAATGCSESGDDASNFNPGSLGQAEFSYTCIDGSDPACAGATTSSSVASEAPAYPLAIAVGSTFRLVYGGTTSTAATASSNVGSALFKPVTSQYLQPIGSGPSDFRVLAPGYGGVYIESTSDSQLIDFTLLHLVTVDSLSIGDGELTAFGKSYTLTSTSLPTVFTVTPFAEETAVAGALDLEWSVDDPTVLALLTANPTARMTATPLKAGTTSLRVTGAGQSTSLSVTVSP